MLAKAVCQVQIIRLNHRFLEPADVEPAQVRTSELTVMMMQLVASGRGVCGMPHWALHEYSSRGYVKAKR